MLFYPHPQQRSAWYQRDKFQRRNEGMTFADLDFIRVRDSEEREDAPVGFAEINMTELPDGRVVEDMITISNLPTERRGKVPAQ
jgi:hypothetical protein